MNQDIIITVYGARQICASCVGAPGSIDTYEWLRAAINRKYVTDDVVTYRYVDIENPADGDEDFVQQIMDEDMFYPLVFVNHTKVAEGIPRLKPIYRVLDRYGLEHANKNEN